MICIYNFRHNTIALYRLQYNVNITFKCTGKPQIHVICFIARFALLWLSGTRRKSEKGRNIQRKRWKEICSCNFMKLWQLTCPKIWSQKAGDPVWKLADVKTEEKLPMFPLHIWRQEKTNILAQVNRQKECPSTHGRASPISYSRLSTD